MAVDITVFPLLSPRIIQINAPQTEATVQDIYNAVREYEDSYDGDSFEFLIDAGGKEDLGGGTTVGITATLNNAQLRFAARPTPTTQGTATSPNSDGRILIDGSATFITDGVEIGDTVLNLTTLAIESVINVISETQIETFQMLNGSRQDWQIGDNYLVYPNDQCRVTGGNLVAVDENGNTISSIFQSPNTQVLLTSSSSATLQELADIQYATFQQAIWIDVNATEDGLLALGSPENPVNTLEKAIPIAVANGFNRLIFLSNYEFGATVNISNYELIGQGIQKTEFTCIAGCVLAGCEIREATIGGEALGIVGFYNSKLKPLVFSTSIFINIEVIIDNCLFGDGTTTIPSNFEGQITMRHCESDVPYTGTPKLDINGAACKVIARGYTGGFEFLNITSSLFECSFDLDSGQVKLGATNTAGKLVVRGDGKFIDLNGDYIENGISAGGMTVLNETSLFFMLQILRMTGNKVEVTGDVATVYKEDGSTVWKQFDLANRQRIPL